MREIARISKPTPLSGHDIFKIGFGECWRGESDTLLLLPGPAYYCSPVHLQLQVVSKYSAAARNHQPPTGATGTARLPHTVAASDQLPHAPAQGSERYSEEKTTRSLCALATWHSLTRRRKSAGHPWSPGAPFHWTVHAAVADVPAKLCLRSALTRPRALSGATRLPPQRHAVRRAQLRSMRPSWSHRRRCRPRRRAGTTCRLCVCARTRAFRVRARACMRAREQVWIFPWTDARADGRAARMRRGDMPSS
jgi:hypothetical protein